MRGVGPVCHTHRSHRARQNLASETPRRRSAWASLLRWLMFGGAEAPPPPPPLGIFDLTTFDILTWSGAKGSDEA